MPLQLLFEIIIINILCKNRKTWQVLSLPTEWVSLADQFSFPFSLWTSSNETSKVWLLACVLVLSAFQEPFHPHVSDHRINILKSHFIFGYVFTASVGARGGQKGVLDPLSWSYRWLWATPVGARNWNRVLFKSSNLCFVFLFVFLFQSLPAFPNCGLMWPTIP